MVSLTELSTALGPQLVPAGRRDLPPRQLTGVHVSELEDPTPYLDGGELLLTTGMPLGSSAAAADRYVARLRSGGIHALGIGLGPWLREVPGHLVRACDEAGIQVLAVPDGVPFQNVSRAFWRLWARSGQADLLGSLGTQTALARATMRPDGTAAVIRGLAQALGGWAAFLPADTGAASYWPESTEALLPQLRAETVRLNRAGTHSAATFEIHGQAVVEYPIPLSGRTGRNHGFLAVGPGRKLSAADRHVITTVSTLLALKARQQETASSVSAALGAAVANLLLLGHTEAARILADDVGLGELPRRVRVLAVPSDDAGGPVAALRAVSHLVPEPGVPPLARALESQPLRHERDGILYLLLPQDHDSDSATPGTGATPRAGATPAAGTTPAAGATMRTSTAPAAGTATADGEATATGAGQPPGDLPGNLPGDLPGFAGALSEPVSLGEVSGILPGLRRALAQARSGFLVGTGAGHHTAARAWVTALAGYSRADLVGTVTEYLRHRGHWENASRALGIHRNSLRHRLGIAVSLLGVDLDDPDVFAPLWLELREHGS